LTLPTFFIIGAAKAGTTSLHSYLDQHPEIQMSAIKETNFFSGPAGATPYPVGRVSNLDEYEELFDPSVEVRGESSPSYTNFPRRRGVPEAIENLVPEAKFVYVVRDPIARTASHYQMLVTAGKERRTLDDALAALDRADPHSHRLTCQSFYARQLEQYLRRFPQERILVVDQADLLSNRQLTLREAFSFLSVDDAFTSAQFETEHFKGHERPVYPRLLRAVKPALAAPARWLPRGPRDSLRRSLEGKLLPKAAAPSLSGEWRARLGELYADDVARLRALTGKPFTKWSI
jgi:Sulfotransferase family